MKNSDIPILFIIFYRPELALKVFEEIKNVKPARLYIACDGWRENVPGEKEKVLQNRKNILEQIDWDCQLKTMFLDTNQGSGMAVFQFISWVFENEEMAIILEEDCLPSASFFPYCKELLIKYKDDARVWIISGLNHFSEIYTNHRNDSYFFSKYASIWGWASWRRCWQEADFHMEKWNLFKNEGYIFDHVPRCDGEVAYQKYNNFYNRYKSIVPKTWDAQFGFAIWSNRGMGIVPSENLIMNVGTVGVHSSKHIKFAHSIPVDSNFKIQNHPAFIQTNHIYDDLYFKTFRKPKNNLFPKIIKKLKNLSIALFR